MTYIQTGIDRPGISELLAYKDSTGQALAQLAQVLLHGSSPLPAADRELIAAYVSKLNSCEFCYESHAAAANAHLKSTEANLLLTDIESAAFSDKLKALLHIASKVQQGGKNVHLDDIHRAKNCGALDEEIHDTVLIAAAFCMFNRYVDGLNTQMPDSKDAYIEMGERMAKRGYI